VCQVGRKTLNQSIKTVLGVDICSTLDCQVCRTEHFPLPFSDAVGKTILLLGECIAVLIGIFVSLYGIYV